MHKIYASASWEYNCSIGISLVSLVVYILVCSSSSKSLWGSFGIRLLSSSAGIANVVVRCFRLWLIRSFRALVDSLLYLTWVWVRLLLFLCVRMDEKNGRKERKKKNQQNNNHHKMKYMFKLWSRDDWKPFFFLLKQTAHQTHKQFVKWKRPRKTEIDSELCSP